MPPPVRTLVSFVGRNRIRQGETIELWYRSAVAAGIRASVKIVYDNGEDDVFTLPDTTMASSRLLTSIRSVKVASHSGWIVDAIITPLEAIRYGATVAFLSIGPAWGGVICRGRVYQGHDVAIGELEDLRAGPGRLFADTIVQDAAGNVATTYTPAVSDAIRRVWGIVVFYNADANVASRVPRLSITRPLGALPTGFATAANAYVALINGPTLAASEEGTLYVMGGDKGPGFISLNDNGTITYSSTDTAPNPFPIDVPNENEPVTVIVDAGAGLAGDRYSAYALVEEWLVD